MFKSLFSKYMTAFMLIILVSFTMLGAVTFTNLRSYIVAQREDAVEHTSEAARIYLEQSAAEDGSGFSQFVYYRSDALRRYLSTLTDYFGNLTIIVTNPEGDILLTDAASPVAVGSRISGETVSAVLSGESRQKGDFGVFPGDYIAYGLPIRTSDGENIGTVMACSSAASLNELAESLLKTIIMAFLWVTLATLIAVYFISDKIISPIKDVSKAARSFAAGNFDARVPVVGRDEVAELATAFNNMAGSIAGMEETRRTFLANVSHDLRTPMTTISGFVDNILDGVIKPENQEHYLRIVSSETKRLSRLVQQLLDISRIESGSRKFTMTTFDICEMARQIIISFESKIDQKKLDVDFDCTSENMYVSADRDAIYQILYNICDNGIKFARDGGKYRVSITQRGGKDYVSVYDEGIGIPEEDLPHVFDRFYKGDKSRGMDKTGVGLGMYISKTIIDAHKEEIWVNSVYGEYCEFVFTLTPSKNAPEMSGETALFDAVQ